MVMIGMVGVAMVEEGVAVQGGVLFGDEDEAMVCSQLGTMTMVNMMLNLPHVVSMQVRKFWFHDDEDRLLLLKLQLLYYQISNTSYWKQ